MTCARFASTAAASDGPASNSSSLRSITVRRRSTWVRRLRRGSGLVLGPDRLRQSTSPLDHLGVGALKRRLELYAGFSSAQDLRFAIDAHNRIEERLGKRGVEGGIAPDGPLVLVAVFYAVSWAKDGVSPLFAFLHPAFRARSGAVPDLPVAEPVGVPQHSWLVREYADGRGRGANTVRSNAPLTGASHVGAA